MSNRHENDELNPLEKQVADIDEWQKNSTNPGYFVGSGKVPLPLRNLLKSPIIMLIIGVIFAVPVIHNLAAGLNIETISSNIMMIIISGGLIIGGIIRILKKG